MTGSPTTKETGQVSEYLDCQWIHHNCSSVKTDCQAGSEVGLSEESKGPCEYWSLVLTQEML